MTSNVTYQPARHLHSKLVQAVAIEYVEGLDMVIYSETGRAVRAVDDTTERFLRISRAKDIPAAQAATLDFVGRCGPLCICRHNQLRTHSDGQHQIPGDEAPCYARMIGSNRWAEPVGAYWMLSKQARAWLEIANVLLLDRRLTTLDRRVLADAWTRLKGGALSAWNATPADLEENDYEAGAWKPAQFPKRRQLDELSAQFNTWLGLGGVQPRVTFEGGNYSTSMEPSITSSWGNVVMGLLPMVRKSEPVVCDGCGHPYVPTYRKPQRHRRNFCLATKCKQAGAKLRQQDRRQRLTVVETLG